jgi:hypothetical protein
MQYFVVMIDYGRRGREAIVDPEITRREVVARVVSGEYKNISFIHEIADRSVEDITAEILGEAALPENPVDAGRRAGQPFRSRPRSQKARAGVTPDELADRERLAPHPVAASEANATIDDIATRVHDTLLPMALVRGGNSPEERNRFRLLEGVGVDLLGPQT